MARTPARDHQNLKRDRIGEEDRLKATHGRIVHRYDITHSKTDLNVVSPSIKHEIVLDILNFCQRQVGPA